MTPPRPPDSASPLVIEVRRVRPDEDSDLTLPQQMSDGAAGLDLPAAVTKPVVLAPGERRLVPTGLALALPPGYEGQVRPRSGLAVRHGLTLLNSPGTIDADYRGEVQVVLVNLGAEPYRLERGTRIAQLVVAPVSRVRLVEVTALPETERGTGGFGSTGER